MYTNDQFQIEQHKQLKREPEGLPPRNNLRQKNCHWGFKPDFRLPQQVLKKQTSDELAPTYPSTQQFCRRVLNDQTETRAAAGVKLART